MKTGLIGRLGAGALVTVLGSAGLLALPSTAQAATSLPCDIYGAAGTPCVAAYSTVRALYASYDGPLYQVRRVSDGATANVGLLSAGGYANATDQDTFCARTTCVITELFDQSPEGNNLTIEGAGGAAGADVGASAAALPVVAGGHKVYGLYIAGQTGYRDNNTHGVAVNGQPEGMYMVASGTHVNSGCCFDFGNAETNTDDNGNGHMDAVNLGTECYFSPCSGSGPWVEADMENGLFSGGNGPNTANGGNNSDFVTAMLKNNGQTTYALKGGNAQSGGLSTWWAGALPDIGGYTPMHQEGAIVLGTGGDNSNWSVGSFFEGVMTAGYPSDATDDAVQASIVAAGYSGASNGGTPPAGTITGPGGQCVDVLGDDSGTDGALVDLWGCQSSAVDQHWTHNSDDSLSTLGRCLDIDGDGTAAGTKVELWDCNGVGGQKWVQQANGSLLNPQSGLCLDDPSDNAANGTQLQIWTCNGTPAQQFSVNGGGMVDGPGGQCVDVAGDDTGTDGTFVQLWGCQSYAIDQHWYHNANGSLETLGRCLDIDGDGTAAGTKVELWDCNGIGGQVWQQQSNGSLLNPQSGLCLDDPSDNTADGTQLQIWTCNGAPAQQFPLS
ncbi:MAG TPA: arabinofuranosidase catalytic domain-containing protein [Streptosporangiaceae bacterium]|nr:arabinofuranosidase catalytic domain-containing protein [Streptosporangiaceae bacterium]